MHGYGFTENNFAIHTSLEINFAIRGSPAVFTFCGSPTLPAVFTIHGSLTLPAVFTIRGSQTFTSCFYHSWFTDFTNCFAIVSLLIFLNFILFSNVFFLYFSTWLYSML